MAWTTPRTWVDAEVVTAAIMNTHVRDNLTDLDARVGSSTLYTPTLTEVVNTVTETTVFSATVTQAVSDGDVLIAMMICELLNNSGANRAMDYKIGYGGVDSADLVTANVANSATVSVQHVEHVIGRSGSNAWAAWTAGLSLLTPVNGAQLASPTFTASQTLTIKVTLGVAHASYRLTPKYGAVIHHFA